MTDQSNGSSKLASGTRLMILIKATTKNETLLASIYRELKVEKAHGNSYVDLILEEDLSLKPGKGKLKDCVCFIPSLKKKSKSVNHAATLISEEFEVSRKSHTKDVFRDAYFQDADNVWKPLSAWREKNPLFEDSKNIKEIVNRLGRKSDNPSDFQEILKVINVSVEMAQAVVDLQEEVEDKKSQIQKLLNKLVRIDKLKEFHDVWEKNKINNNELFWHNFLAENSFILSQLFLTPVTILRSKAYVGGKGIENTGGGIADFLFWNKLTKNTSLIEIKTPVTPLLREVDYRQGIYNLSTDLQGAVSQITIYKDSLSKNYNELVDQSEKFFEVFNPLCIVISGNAGSELSENPNKKKSFELHRSGRSDVHIITYDEMFEKLKMLIEILDN